MTALKGQTERLPTANIRQQNGLSLLDSAKNSQLEAVFLVVCDPSMNEL